MMRLKKNKTFTNGQKKKKPRNKTMTELEK
jgi:hypothetical protein